MITGALAACATPAAAQNPTCSTSTTKAAGQAVVTSKCTFVAPKPDTVRLTRVDTLRLTKTDTLYLPSTPTPQPPVTQPSPQPLPSSSLVFEDFSTYTSTANFLSNPRGVWDLGSRINPDRIVLDTSVGYGTSTKSMRYDFPNNGAKCLDYGIHPGSLQMGKVTEVWAEYVVRFKPGWTLDAGASNCGQEYKLAAMGDSYSGIGRWNLPEMQVEELVSGYPGNEAGYVSGMDVPKKLWDGQPHVFRAHAKIGHAKDGVFQFWVDGVLLVNLSGITTDRTHNYINWFSPGMNINQGPAINGMSMWWHKIAISTADPGWR